MAKKVLVIEDDEHIARIIARQLEASGYFPLNAYNGEEGLAMAKKEVPELIIMDLGLPLIDGNTLCEIIKMNPATKGIKVIVLTGDSQTGKMETSFSVGADTYLNKPCEWPRLLSHIEKLIG